MRCDVSLFIGLTKYQYLVNIGIFHTYWYTRMARNTSINLGDHFDDFINQQLSCGRYGSASEVIRAGLRLLEEHETKLNALRTKLTEGEQSGYAEYSLDSLINELDGTDK